MNGKIELISYKNFGIKLFGAKDWLNAYNTFVKAQLKSFKKNETINYESKGNELISLEKVPPKLIRGEEVLSELIQADKVTEGLSHEGEIIRSAVKDMNLIFLDPALSQEFKLCIDWGACVNTIAIERFKKERDDVR